MTTLEAVLPARPSASDRWKWTVHGAFRAQARRTPHATAVEHHPGEAMSYQVLDDRSDRLAARLAAHGAGSGDLIGLYIDRSTEAIVALLAVLKCGAAYVPVDVRQPVTRSADQLDDAGVRTVLTSPARAADIPASLGTVLVSPAPGGAGTLGGPQPRSWAPPPVDPDDLAYVIFTSGSTGRPKGTAVAHRGLVELAQDQMVRWRARPGSRILQFAPLSFDASVTEILVALLSGATLCLADQDDLMPGRDLHRTLAERRITAVKAPPAVLAATPCDDLPDLRLVVSGGGACRADVIDRWSVGRDVRNAYGTTETTVCNTMTGPLRPGQPILLGEPVAGSRLHVLRDQCPVAMGEVGELHIGGVPVSRGYWRRPDLTASRFIPDPFEPGRRLYRTGDLVRRVPGGLMYVGRSDDQLKVRGHRIEPAEVEAVLTTHCGVKDAAVTAHEDRLVAFVVAGHDGVDEQSLRRAATEHLPAYMIPATVVELPQMPLNNRGKLDRKALPPPPAGEQRPRPQAPESALERVWCEVLGVARADPEQNFFHLGGDSLQAAVLVDRVSDVIGARVSLRALLRAPTLGNFVAAVQATSHDGRG